MKKTAKFLKLKLEINMITYSLHPRCSPKHVAKLCFLTFFYFYLLSKIVLKFNVTVLLTVLDERNFAPNRSMYKLRSTKNHTCNECNECSINFFYPFCVVNFCETVSGKRKHFKHHKNKQSKRITIFLYII